MGNIVYQSLVFLKVHTWQLICMPEDKSSETLQALVHLHGFPIESE